MTCPMFNATTTKRTSMLIMGEYCESFMPMEPEIHQKEALRETGSEKSHQMSKKVAPKWFHQEN